MVNFILRNLYHNLKKARSALNFSECGQQGQQTLGMASSCVS